MPLRSKQSSLFATRDPPERLCHGKALSAKCMILGAFQETAEVMSIAVFIYWVLDMPATFITGFDRGGILEMRMRTIARNYIKGTGRE